MARSADITAQDVDRVLQNGAVPHNTALGLRAHDCGDGWITISLPYDEKLVGNPDTGVLHGGAITALLDASCGLAVFLAMPNPQRIATIDLRIDYMGPAPPGKSVVCRAECYKLTRHVAFARAVAYIHDPDDAVATAAGSFMIFDGDLSPMARGLEP